MPKDVIKFHASLERNEFNNICAQDLAAIPKCNLLQTNDGFVLKEEKIDFVKGTWPATAHIQFSDGFVTIQSKCGGMGPFQKRHVVQFGRNVKDIIEQGISVRNLGQGVLSDCCVLEISDVDEKKRRKKIYAFLLGMVLLLAYPAGLYFLNDRSDNKFDIYNQEGSISEKELPDNFMLMTEDQIAQLKDPEELLNLMNESLWDMRIRAYLIFGNFKDENDIISLEAFGVTPQSENILVTFQYSYSISKPEWILVSVKDFDTDHYYYVTDELKKTVDLYNYTSGMLISRKSKESQPETNKKSEMAKEEAAKGDKEKLEQTEDIKPSKSAEKKETSVQQDKSPKSEGKKETDGQQDISKVKEQAEPIEEETEIQEEIPHRDGMYGVSDKCIFELDSNFARSNVRNDSTGNMRISTILENVQMVEYALNYYETSMRDNKRIDGIVNFANFTTTYISALGMDDRIYVTVHEYVDGEEHDANLLFSGMVLEDYIVYTDNGDIEKIQ